MEKDKDIIEIIVDDIPDDIDILNGVISETGEIFEESFADDESEKIETENDGIKEKLRTLVMDFKNFSNVFFIVSSSVCVIIIVAAFILGIVLPKSDSFVANSLASLKENDELYITAKTENSDLTNEVAELNALLEEKRNDLEMFNQSKTSLDKITEENDQLTEERDNLKSEVSSKQTELDRLNALYTNTVQTTVTLTSGRYTVGENIAPGTYTVTGTGSIAIGQSRINATLDSTGKEYTLNDGESIKIDGSAKFILKQ